jgi:hypothetical protein
MNFTTQTFSGKFWGSRTIQIPVPNAARVARVATPEPIMSRLDNVIAVVRGSISRAPSSALYLANGLVEMGYSVLLMNGDEYFENSSSLSRNQGPVKRETNKKFTGELYTWSSEYNILAGSLDKILPEFSEQFDYVIVQEEKTYNRLALGYLATRFITPYNVHMREEYLKHPMHEDILNRTFCIVNNEKAALLWIDENGRPQASGFVGSDVYRKEMIGPGVDRPVIASCHHGGNRVAFAKAILGIGDPNDFYVPSETKKRKSRVHRFSQEPFIHTVTLVMGAFGIVAATGSLTASALTVGVGGSVSAVNVLKSRKINRGKINSKKDLTRSIYPQGVESNYPISAPALSESLAIEAVAKKPFVKVSRTSHARALEKFDKVKMQWLEYELDILKMLDAPLMVDYSCAETAALASAMDKAADSLSDASAAQGTPEESIHKKEFSQAVSELQIAFRVAEDNATRKGLTYLEAPAQNKVQQARNLLMLAQDTGASDSEREVSYAQAMKNLKGIIVLTPEAQKRALESAGVRKEITQN